MSLKTTPSISRPARLRPTAAQAALDAAQLAEWNSKKWVWIPNKDEGYLAGYVVKEEGEVSTVALESGEVLPPIATMDLYRVNPPTYDGAEDIADLTYLNEASVVHNLKHRYSKDSIYTYSGLFLVAINPYKTLPIYSSRTIERYKNKRRDENPPHVYAVAEKAWQSMMQHRDQSQSILVTGESGAGKTENTKKVIQYLAAIASEPSTSSIDLRASRAGNLTRTASVKELALGKKLGQLEQQILEANPILESFGNAQTVKNNNSSRFGKFVRIFFNNYGAIAGANIDWYLLEKSRVTSRSEHERGFHIFFQLLRGANSTLKQQLLLSGTPKDFNYLRASRYDVDGMDDKEEWDNLLYALNTVGFTQEEQLNLFQVIAVILHLGNISVGGTETAHLTDPKQLEKVAHLLGTDPSQLSNALIRPKIKAGTEWVAQSRTRKQVLDEIAAMSKALYEKNFGAVVERINKALGTPSTRTFIGVLDIAGFEIFDVNGFEQLCINLTNEKLQQFFNHHMFVLEQEEYNKEDIEWEFRNFGLELQPTIDLIESNNPMGILSCLDDACIMPKATDKSFTSKLETLAKTHPNSPQYSQYSASRFEQGFTVSHYAGQVEYRTEGWLDKNRDPLSDNLTSLLANSTSPYISTMFAEYAEQEPMDGPRVRVRKGAFRTVGQRHKDQLAFLMTQLRNTQPHFVRCIVPNLSKTAGIIDTPLVLDQLRCNGVLEGIRIARLGFPNRLPFSEFRRRFEVLAPGAVPKGFVDGLEASRKILTVLNLDPRTYQLGLTKVFFKAGILAELEERRDEYLSGIFTKVQAGIRMFIARRQANKILNRAAAVRTIQRNARLYGELKNWPWWPLFQRVRPLLAAARSDDEIRKKAEELAAAKEAAEKEAKERKRLEDERLELETRQRRMEEDLASERARLGEQETLLLASQSREEELAKEIVQLGVDLETSEALAEKSLLANKALENRINELGSALKDSSALIKTLQDEQVTWKAREAELATQTSLNTAEFENIVAEKNQNAAKASSLSNELSDSKREVERINAALANLEARFAKESKDLADSRKIVGRLESEVKAGGDQVAKYELERRDVMARLGALDAETSLAKKNAESLILERDEALTNARDFEHVIATLNAQLDSLSRQLEESKSLHFKMDQERTSLKKMLEEKSSDHERAAQLNALKETELQALKAQVEQTNNSLEISQRNAASEGTRLRQEIADLKRDNSTLLTKLDSTSKSLKTAETKNSDMEERVITLEHAQQAHDLNIELIRTQAAEETLQEREKWEKEKSQYIEKFQKLEDETLAAQRRVAQLEQDVKAERVLYQEEQRIVKTREATINSLNQKVEKQYNVLTAMDKENGELREEMKDVKTRLKFAEDKGGKLVVEHIRVLEETMRIQNVEMEKIKSDQKSKDAYIRTLERARSSLTQSLEDIQHERETERRQQWQNKPAPDTKSSRLEEQLESEKKLRELAELNVTRLRSEIQHQQHLLDGHASEKTVLTRKLKDLEQELNWIAASDHNEQVTLPKERATRPVSMSGSRGMVMNAVKNMPSATSPATPSPPANVQPTFRRRGYE